MAILRTLGADLRLSARPALAFAAIGFFWAAVAAQVPDLKARIGASDAEFGGVFLLAALGTMSAMWIAARAARWLGRYAVAGPMALTALLFLLPGLATGIPGFAAAMLLAAAATGLTDVLMNARVSELEAEAGRPLMNLNHAVFSFGYALSAALTGLARTAGWPPAAVFAALAAVTLALCPFMVHVRRPATIEAPAGAAPIRSWPIVWIAGLVVLIAFLSESSVEGWSALHLERTLGGSPAEGAMGPALLGLTMGFGRLFGQLVAARFAEWAMIAAACLVSAVGLLLAAAAPSLTWAYLGFGAMGLGVSVVAPLALGLVGRSVPPALRVAAIGRTAAVGYAAFSIGPGMMGAISQAFGLRWSFLAVAVLLLVAATVLAPRLARLAPRPSAG